MSPKKNIVVVGYNGAQLLDIAGPVQVFASANDELQDPVYDITLASIDGSSATPSCGIRMEATPLSEIDPKSIHTLIIVGGEADDVTRVAANQTLQAFVKACADTANRLCSVCTGTYVLASAGVAAGKQVATHWRASRHLQRLHPEINVDPEAIFVCDGKVWSSAGVTTGIDMCLALVEADISRAVSMAVARRLVVYARRPGSQSQFSAMLNAQKRAGSEFAATVDWMVNHMAEPLSVADVAEVAGMSERSFHRKFAAKTGETPARFLETLRLDRARTLLETGDLPVKTIAGQVGLGSAGRFIQTFERRLGLTPTAYRRLHGQP